VTYKRLVSKSEHLVSGFPVPMPAVTYLKYRHCNKLLSTLSQYQNDKPSMKLDWTKIMELNIK